MGHILIYGPFGYHMSLLLFNNRRYSAPASLIDTTGASFIFSMNKRVSSYSGPCIRVYNTGNGQYKDIGFTTSGVVDVADILQFSGNNTCTVAKWYDQISGASTVDTVVSKFPIIAQGGQINSGAATPGLYFDGTVNYYMIIPNTFLGSGITQLTFHTKQKLLESGGGGATQMLFSYITTNDSNAFYYGSTGGRDIASVNDVTATTPSVFPLNEWSTNSATWNAANPSVRMKLYRNGSLVGSSTASFGNSLRYSSTRGIVIGQDQDTILGSFATENSYFGYINEIMMFTAEKDATTISSYI